MKRRTTYPDCNSKSEPRKLLKYFIIVESYLFCRRKLPSICCFISAASKKSRKLYPFAAPSIAALLIRDHCLLSSIFHGNCFRDSLVYNIRNRAFKHSLIRLRDFPPRNKSRITSQYFHFLKIADLPAFTRGRSLLREGVNFSFDIAKIKR